MQKATATLIKNQVTSNDSLAHTLFQKSHFGEKIGEKILYSKCEALFLLEQNKLQILDSKNNKINKETLLKKFSRSDKNFQTKYPVFKDLRKKGHIIKTALKFGSDFRVYEKGKRANAHSKWICQVIPENKSLKLTDFTSKARVAHSSKKPLLLAILDEENKVTYYEVKWTQT